MPEFCGPSLLFGLRACSRRTGVGRVLVSGDGARTWQARRPLEETTTWGPRARHAIRSTRFAPGLPYAWPPKS